MMLTTTAEQARETRTHSVQSTHAYCQDQQPGEPITDYHARVLTYALSYGIEPLTLSQLDAADSQAQQHVCAQPGTLNQDQAKLDGILHSIRSRLQARMEEKRAQLAGLQRLLDRAGQEAEQAANAPAGAGMAELSSHEQACKLMAAALRLILEPGSDSDGGSGARLIRPTPTRPPSGQAINPRDTIQF